MNRFSYGEKILRVSGPGASRHRPARQPAAGPRSEKGMLHSLFISCVQLECQADRHRTLPPTGKRPAGLLVRDGKIWSKV